MFIFLIHPALILIPTVIAFTTGSAQQIGSDGNHDLTIISSSLIHKHSMSLVQQRQTMVLIIMGHRQTHHFGIFPQGW
ncbi:hypothetical protein BH18THE2_BH18THE2_32840 [soil metagenome]